jgi:hypothetical protein
MIKTKIIKYYRKSNYGVEREFIHPDNKTEATQLTKMFVCKFCD